MDAVDNKAAVRPVNTDMSLGIVLITTSAVCILIAALLWLLVPSIAEDPFTSVLTHSLGIGLMAALLTVFITGRLSDEKRTSAIWLTVILIPVSVIAFVSGTTLAELLLGLPIEPFSVFANNSDTASFLTTVVATAVCTGFFLSRNQLNRLRLQAAEDGHRVQTAELAMLKAQIEPHMLFNTLANLRALIRTDPERAVFMLDRLDAFLRTTLEGSRSPAHALSREFAVIESYLAIMQVRLGERLSYSLDLPETLAEIEVPSLIIQPVVENAILHGIEPAKAGGHLTVCAWRQSNILFLEVSDTGIGFRNVQRWHSTVRSNGFGLHSLHERLPAFGGLPGVQVESPILTMGSGTKVLLRIQI